MRRRLGVLLAAGALAAGGSGAAGALAQEPPPPVVPATQPGGETVVQLSDDGRDLGTGTVIVLALLLGLFWLVLRRLKLGDTRRAPRGRR